VGVDRPLAARVNVIIFGATGMIGQGVLRECLIDPAVERVLTVGRNATGRQHAKLREIVHQDLLDFTTIRSELGGYDACFFCLGVTSAGMTEADYRRVTYDIAMAAARTLVELNPGMTFIFVSGAGADSSERGRIMWARVKGATENAILALPFKASYVFRPAFVQPLHGIVSRTSWYNALYRVFGPLFPLLGRVAPNYTLTTEQIGRAMLSLARRSAEREGGAEPPTRVLESGDIRSVTLKK
jgi:uncharacterized protein YbjT (DUF2867 family)